MHLVMFDIDGVWDLRAARRTGYRFIGIGSGRREARLRERGAVWVVSDFDESPGFLEILQAIWESERARATGGTPTLVEPTTALRDAYRDFIEEFGLAGEPHFQDERSPVREDFPAFVRRLLDLAKGVGVPEGWVPATRLWFVRGDRVLGTCDLRQRLTEALREFGGHVGYNVRPSERNQGLGAHLLRSALIEAGKRGIDRALITCDAANAASIRVIEKNGGILESEGFSPLAGRVTRRYRVSCPDG